MPRQGSVDVVNEVIRDLLNRSNEGRKKYGTPLMSGNGRNALVDAYQEALDLTQYLKQVLIEREGGARTDNHDAECDVVELSNLFYSMYGREIDTDAYHINILKAANIANRWRTIGGE